MYDFFLVWGLAAPQNKNKTKCLCVVIFGLEKNKEENTEMCYYGDEVWFYLVPKT